MQWEVTGADRSSGEDRTIILDADTEDSARRRANRRGLLVASARPLDPNDSAIATKPPLPTAPTPSGDRESAVWSGSPSQFANLPTFIVCGLFCWMIFPAFLALLAFLRTRATRYEVTTQRIRITSGLLSRQMNEMELYRVRDIVVGQPFFLRLRGLGNLIVLSTDTSHPSLFLRAIPGVEALKESIRDNGHRLRSKHGVREFHGV